MKRCRVRDIVKIKKGEYITKAQEKEGVYPVILGGKEPAYYINRYNHEGKAIVVSRSGASAGYVSFWNEPIFITDGFLIEPIEGMSHEYLYYVLKSRQGLLHNMQNGAAIPHITPTLLGLVDVVLHDLDEQENVVDILSSFDRLIENNTKRIKLLEQMAENLYKEWFVRFRFPGYKDVMFSNGFPNDWKKCKLQDFVIFTRGVGYGSKDITEGDAVLLSMNNLRPYGGFIEDYSRPYSGKYKASQVVNENDLIMSITDMTQDRRIIGYVGLVPSSVENRVISMHLLKLKSDVYSNYFLYGLFNFSGLSRVIAERATGTNVLGMTVDILNNVRCYVPPVEIAKNYSNLVKPIFDEIFLLFEENRILIKQRDLLLPRLMSGKLKVN